MDSWANGKERLLEEVGKAYDAIGVRLASELDEENTVRARKTEWQTLTEKSTRESTRCTELVQENARLAGELERCKSTVARVEELERDNQRLRTELATALEEKQEDHEPPSRARVEELERDNKRLSTELVTALEKNQQDNELPSRARAFNSRSASPADPVLPFPQRVEENGAASVSGDKYDLLVRKHNFLYNQWKHHKTRHEELEAVVNNQRERVFGWVELVENHKNKAASNKIKIKQLKEEVQSLKSAAVNGTEAPKDVPELQAPEDVPEQSTPSFPVVPPTAKEKPWLGAVAAMALNTDLPAHTSSTVQDEVAQAVGNVRDDSLESAGRPDAGREKSLDIMRGLEEELGITKQTSRAATIIHDSEEEEEEESEAELSLPKLPRSSENKPPRLLEKPELSEHHHSNTTDEDASPMVTEEVSQELHIKVTSSSSPIVVSTRTVKKRKSLHEAKTQTAKVKLEIGSSSPSQQRTHSSDSIDLDDIGQKVATPRKPRRRLMDKSKGQQATSPGSRSRVRSQLREVSEQAQEAPVRNTATGRTGSALQPLSVNKQVTPRALEKRDPKRRRIADDNAIEGLTEDGVHFVPGDTRKDNGWDETLANLLDKPSPEKQVLNPVRMMVSARRPLTKSGLAIHRDAESEEPELPRLGRHFDQLRPTSALSSRSRKSEKKSWPASKESAEPQRPNFKGFSKSSMASMTTPRPASRDTPQGYNTPQFVLPKSRTSESMFGMNESAKVTPVQPASRSNKSSERRRHARTRQAPQTAAEWEFDPEQMPLRNRPVQTLRLSDFKINPNYNQGNKYAYSEVVRDKDQRQGLHACTKPGCCGEKFRALAMAGRNFDAKRTSAEKIADDIMMREFLGDNAHKLERMAKEEKDKLWITARTRQLAQQHGRHRHAYERQPTPPGFWQADFPTSQEEIEQRNMQEEAVRVNVQQRYEEAMRRGAYIFADE